MTLIIYRLYGPLKVLLQNFMISITGVTQVLDKPAPIISHKAKQQSDEWLSDSYRMARSLRRQFERRWRKRQS